MRYETHRAIPLSRYSRLPSVDEAFVVAALDARDLPATPALTPKDSLRQRSPHAHEVLATCGPLEPRQRRLRRQPSSLRRIPTHDQLEDRILRQSTRIVGILVATRDADHACAEQLLDFLFGHSSGCTLVAIVATDPRYLEEQGLGPEAIAGVIPMGCRLNDYVEITDTPPPRYEASWVPAARINDFMKGEVAFVSLEQRNAAVPAAHVSERLPPTLVLIADAERFFPPILRDAAEFVGRALVHGAQADIAILANRRHMTAVQMMVRTDDPAVIKVIEFVRAH